MHKALVTILGGLMLTAGMIMLVTPGPGLLTIAAGLAILGTEYRWARRLLRRVRERIRRQVESANSPKAAKASKELDNPRS